MARGSVIRRCRICRREGKSGFIKCSHKEAEYIAVYRVGNKQKWETVGRNKKDAERRLSEILFQINNGTYRKTDDILFKDFAQKWIEKYATIRVKLSTLKTYQRTINCHLIPAFGEFYLRYITTERIQEFMADMLKKRKPKTMNNTLIMLKTMFKHARKWGYVIENPAQDIENARLEHKEMDFLNPEEIRLMLKHSQEPFKTLFLTAILTGMRRSELLALQWGDIDWNSNTVFVRRSLYWLTRKEIREPENKRFVFMNPKSKRSIRAIVISPVLKKALEIHRVISPVSPYDLVFCNKKGNPLDPDSMVKREFIPTLTAAGLRKIRFHDLRHTYTTLLIAQGENIKFIQNQLGHASIQTTLDRYGHLFPVNQQGVGERVDRQIFEVSANTRLTEYPQTRANTTYQEQNGIGVSISNR